MICLASGRGASYVGSPSANTAAIGPAMPWVARDVMTMRPSGGGDGLAIHRASPARAGIPYVPLSRTPSTIPRAVAADRTDICCWLRRRLAKDNEGSAGREPRSRGGAVGPQQRWPELPRKVCPRPPCPYRRTAPRQFWREVLATFVLRRAERAPPNTRAQLGGAVRKLGTVRILAREPLRSAARPTVSRHGCARCHDTVSERLRRWTRNPLGSARRGSNPLGVVVVGNGS